jgi:hypothetical protein
MTIPFLNSAAARGQGTAVQRAAARGVRRVGLGLQQQTEVHCQWWWRRRHGLDGELAASSHMAG